MKSELLWFIDSEIAYSEYGINHEIYERMKANETQCCPPECQTDSMSKVFII